MEKRSNYIKGEEPAVVTTTPVAKPPKPKKKVNWSRRIFNIIGGEFLANRWNVRQINFILFLAILGVIYIANSYYAESIARQIDRVTRDLKELQFEYISSKSQVMQHSKQSELTRKLSSTGLKESVTPVKKIIIPKN